MGNWKGVKKKKATKVPVYSQVHRNFITMQIYSVPVRITADLSEMLQVHLSPVPRWPICNLFISETVFPLATLMWAVYHQAMTRTEGLISPGLISLFLSSTLPLYWRRYFKLSDTYLDMYTQKKLPAASGSELCVLKQNWWKHFIIIFAKNQTFNRRKFLFLTQKLSTNVLLHTRGTQVNWHMLTWIQGQWL